MKIICVGFWKTGTKSLAKALRILGYKVYDYDYQYFELGKLWDKFFDGTVTDDEIYLNLKDIDVVIEGPAIAFWEEIHHIFPEAKIILSTREENSWYRSYRAMYEAVPAILKLRFLTSMLTPLGYNYLRRLKQVSRFCLGIDVNLAASANSRLYKLKFRKHNSYVLRCAPEDKLLTYNVKDGWSTLCKFLCHDMPNEPYPHENKAGAVLSYDQDYVHPQMQKLLARSNVMLILSPLVLVLCFTIYFMACYE